MQQIADFTDEQVLRAAIDAVQKDLQQTLGPYANRAGVSGRILRHAVCELLGSLMVDALAEEDAAGRAECARLVESLQMLVMPTGKRPC